MTITTKKRRILLKASTAVALIISAKTVFAGDVTVNMPNTSISLNDGDNLIVTSGGSLSNSAGDAVRDATSGSTVSIDNSGTIESTSSDYGSDGIDTQGSTLSSLVNSGSIISVAGSGVHSHAIGSFSNSGTISAARSGIAAYGGVTTFINEVGATISATIYEAVHYLNGSSSPDKTFINHGNLFGGSVGFQDKTAGTFTSFNNSATGVITGKTGVIFDGGAVENFVNSGVITGTANHGIYSDVNISKIVNNAGAKIEADAKVSDTQYAIYVNGVLSTLENAGTITGGEDIDYAAVRAEQGIGQLTNTGTITGNTGVSSGSYITSLTNSGKIEGTMDFGISASSEIKSLTNEKNGEIVSNNVGIRTYSGGIENLNNAGTIQAKTPIFIYRASDATNATITNSGAITSTKGASGTAIYLGNSAADTINIEAGSSIIGKIDWDGTKDTVNFAVGLSNTLEFTNTPDNINFASALSAVVKNTVVQADTSSVNIIDDAVADVASAASALVGAQAGSVFQTPENASVQTPDDIDGFGYGVMSNFVDRNAWVSLWGAGSFQEKTSTLADTTAYSAGVLGGIDWRSSDGNLFGIHAGAGLGEVTVNVTDGQTIDSSSLFGGVYGRYYQNEIAVDYNITAGMMQFNSDRSISGGNETAKAEYNGYFIQPEIKFSKETDIGDRTFIPSVGFGYKGVFVDEYSETGSSSNVSVNARSVHYALANAQIDLIADFKATNGDTVMFRPYVGAEGSFIMGENTATASLLTTTTTFDTGGDKNVVRGFVGANFAKNLDDTTKLFGGGEVSYNSSKNTAFNVRLGISKSF